MQPVKIMPCLDMKEGRVVKGVNFVGLRDAGDPVENAAFYQREGADILLAASVFHFRTPSIRQVKEYLKGKGIPVTGA